MKRLSILVVLATMFLLAFSGVAYANFAIHGGYSLDTDACAGCHRAHTSFSELRWASQYDPAITSSALLVSSADTMTEFCNTCHGPDAPGASTNVVEGVFDSGPSADVSTTVGASSLGTPTVDPTLYQTNSTFDAVLNGGGFSTVGAASTQSMHSMDATGTMWGFGASVDAAEYPNLTCTSCHDVHGSSNYRLLKDSLPGGAVGGYLPDGTPQPFVISAEQGYPAGGWLKHEDGAAQMNLYRPNYTAPEYAYQPPAVPGEFRSMSGWCAGCHQQYIVRESAYNYGTFEGLSASMGSVNRHRHPVNVTLAAGVGPDRNLVEEVRLQPGISVEESQTQGGFGATYALPLEARPASPLPRGTWGEQDYIGCLTCHRAHGSDAVMTGWAEATIELIQPAGSVSTTDGVPSVDIWGPVIAPGRGGVEPLTDSALLRFDNRGVCERCHNK
ncbi:MAG: cytochrome c3 family protein [Anaerosomatales bacterium]|nr:cytochrome c3 family protein [Anaerosomatales bacterium]